MMTDDWKIFLSLYRIFKNAMSSIINLDLSNIWNSAFQKIEGNKYEVSEMYLACDLTEEYLQFISHFRPNERINSKFTHTSLKLFP